jgi:hypothetical protein
MGCFVAHAPRQTGKTTTLRARRGAGRRGGARGPALLDGKRGWQREAVELRVWREGEPDPLAAGLAQLDGYLERLGLATGVLVVFDRRPPAAPIAERARFAEATTPAGRAASGSGRSATVHAWASARCSLRASSGSSQGAHMRR